MAAPQGTGSNFYMMGWETKFKEAIKEDLMIRQKKNPQYSQRAYARDIEISPAALTRLIKEEDFNMGLERAAEILRKMELPDRYKNQIFVSMGCTVPVRRTEIKEENFAFISDPDYSTLLFAHELNLPSKSVKNLAQKFKIQEDKVEKVLKDLVGKGLLKPDRDGILRNTEVNWSAEEAPPPEAIRNHHKNNLRQAIQSIESVPATDRDLSSLTFTASLKNLEKIRAEIRQFHERISTLMDEDENNDEVFKLSVALFPVREGLQGEHP